MTVSELMSKSVVTVTATETTAFAASLLARHNLGSLPVCAADGTLKGLVTDRDIVLRCVAADNDPWETPIRDIMSRSPLTVAPEDDVKTALRLMAGQQVRRLPVTSGNKVVGMISLGDLAKCNALDMEAARALGRISENVRRAE